MTTVQGTRATPAVSPAMRLTGTGPAATLAARTTDAGSANTFAQPCAYAVPAAGARRRAPSARRSGVTALTGAKIRPCGSTGFTVAAPGTSVKATT